MTHHQHYHYQPCYPYTYPYPSYVPPHTHPQPPIEGAIHTMREYLNRD